MQGSFNAGEPNFDFPRMKRRHYVLPHDALIGSAIEGIQGVILLG